MDFTPLSQLNSENHDFEVLTLAAGETSGNHEWTELQSYFLDMLQYRKKPHVHRKKPHVHMHETGRNGAGWRINIEPRLTWTGVIPSQGSRMLNWMFNPLEAKSYSVQIPIELGSGASDTVTITGSGYLPSQRPQGTRNCHDHIWTDWPYFNSGPSIVLDQHLASISPDMVSFGNMITKVRAACHVTDMMRASK